jgi:pSer/pThr/pTyr-binding forkhead associated (FHA) protein
MKYGEQLTVDEFTELIGQITGIRKSPEQAKAYDKLISGLNSRYGKDLSFVARAMLVDEKIFNCKYELPRSKSRVSVGRSRDNDIFMPAYPNTSNWEKLGIARSVAPVHATIEVKDGKYFINDAGSPRGTYVNGVLVESPVEVGNGDIVTLGDYPVRFVRR